MALMDPIAVSHDIIDTYSRYIMTRFPLGKTNPEIRRQFKELLYSSEGKQRLIKGPILEIMPPYKQGRSFKELSSEYPAWKPLVSHFEEKKSFPVERPLFLHQEKALIKSLTGNIVISSGTGSGKTECFLFPIFQYCLEHPGEGVRAVLVYPLNALVEDQIERLGKYLHGTNITFGKYTGQTPNTKKKKTESKGEKKHSPNHMISREEMRHSSPNILVTNYAMLEYMLIRPGDSPIIDKRDSHTFRFVVLDEVHSYSGAAGTEVAYLLRRLRHRVGRRVEDTRYFTTSATLGAGDDVMESMVTFARRLFGAPFSLDSVIKGEKEDLSKLMPHDVENTLEADSIAKWGLPGPTVTTEEIKQKMGIDCDKLDLKQKIYNHLKRKKQIKELIIILESGPKPVEELAEQLFPDRKNAVACLVYLVAWANFARNDSDLSLLPARYHMLVSATKGIFCELSIKGSRVPWKHLALSQQDVQKKVGNPYPFELGVCRICGEPYIMGVFVRDENGLKYKPIADSFFETLDSEDSESFKVILHPSPRPSGNYNPYKVCRLCGAVNEQCEHSRADMVELSLLDTSQTFYNELADDIPTEESEEPQVKDKEKQKTNGCINCGSGKGLAKNVFPLRFPANGSTAPLVSILFSHCPEMDEQAIEKHEETIRTELQLGKRNRDWTPIIARGKKLLLFSDSRQEAAFFGPYMQVSHNQMAFSRFMIDILLNQTTSLPIVDWKDIANNKLKRFLDTRVNSALLLNQVRPSEDFKNELLAYNTKRVQRIYHAICHLIDSTASSLSGLEGIGIGAVYFSALDFADDVDLPQFSKVQIQALAQLILRFFRLNEIFYLEPEEDIDLGKRSFDAYFAYRYSKKLLISEEDKRGRENIIRLISTRKNPNRLQTLIRHCIARLKKIELDYVKVEEVNEVIEKICNEFNNSELKSAPSGIGKQLDITKLRIMPAEKETGEFLETIPGGLPRFKSCKKCGRLSWIDLDNMCNYPGCFGELTDPENSLQLSKDNHYRHYFLFGDAIADLRAVEHTAQLETTAAKDYQEEFKRGRLNILSCSTTFEMGVDLGDLTTIFLKNVPPGIANYVQRAGRAGRRTGISPFVLTFCRSLPHDQYYFENYKKLVKGEVKPPAIVLENSKILTRHFNAVILADFLKEYKDGFSRESRGSGYIKDPILLQLFECSEKFSAPLSQEYSRMMPSQFLCEHWLLAKYDYYRKKIKEIFSMENHISYPFLTETLDKYIEQNVFSSGERYGLQGSIAKKYLDTISYYQSEMDKYDPAGDKEQEENFSYYKNLIDQTKNEQLIAHLSSHGFLPSYAFPTNVVPMKVLSDKTAEKRLDLNRDLSRAIVEYAPGSKIAANSRIYASGALHKFPKQVFKIYCYFHCRACNWFTCKLDKEQVKEAIDKHIKAAHKDGQEKEKSRNPHRAVYPEWGFAVPRDKPGEKIRTGSRLERCGYSSEFFMDIDAFQPKIKLPLQLPQKGTLKIEFANGYDIYRINPGKITGNVSGMKEYNGFKICKKCGRSLDEGKMIHETPYGKECDGRDILQGHLISMFDTDITKFVFEDSNTIPPKARESSFKFKSFWRSVLYAFIESICRTLEIERNDIDGLFIPVEGQPMVQLVFIDSVSGGAGHVSRLVGKGKEDPQVLLNRIIEEAKSILSCKECTENTACYSCLFHHSNQNVQHTLNRGLALKWFMKL